jgi:hypothetical protein
MASSDDLHAFNLAAANNDLVIARQPTARDSLNFESDLRLQGIMAKGARNASQAAVMHAFDRTAETLREASAQALDQALGEEAKVDVLIQSLMAKSEVLTSTPILCGVVFSYFFFIFQPCSCITLSTTVTDS